MYDRSFYTEAYHRDDSVTRRIADRSEILWNGASDFIHGDEAPLLVEVENNDEGEASDYGSVADRTIR